MAYAKGNLRGQKKADQILDLPQNKKALSPFRPELGNTYFTYFKCGTYFTYFKRGRTYF